MIPIDANFNNADWIKEVRRRKMKEKAKEMKPKYPHIKVKLVGTGNAFAILSEVNRALRRAGVGPDERRQFQTEAMSGDYNHLLRTCMHWVDVH